jgi:integrase
MYLDEHRKAPKSELLFQSKSGRPLHQSNILRRTLHPILKNLNEPKCVCQAFRRFRITHLREIGVPDDLVHYWVGHAGKSVSDAYSKLKLDLAFRKEVAERVGLGFELLPRTTAIGPKLETDPVPQMAACA